jgi:hypothetical protein
MLLQRVHRATAHPASAATVTGNGIVQVEVLVDSVSMEPH